MRKFTLISYTSIILARLVTILAAVREITRMEKKYKNI